MLLSRFSKVASAALATFFISAVTNAQVITTLNPSETVIVDDSTTMTLNDATPFGGITGAELAAGGRATVCVHWRHA